MASLNYLLTYAGVPFLESTAKVVRLDFEHPEKTSDKAALFPRKYQPEATLEDELERQLPGRYLQDYVLPGGYPGRTMQGVALPQGRGQHPRPESLKLYDWVYPIGASRWGVFRGLATTAMKDAMLQATQGRLPATFVMRSVPTTAPAALTGAYTVSTAMYMLPPRPLAENAGGLDGLWLVTLVDERYYWQFASVTLRPDGVTSWADLITQVSAALGVTVVNPPTVPGVYGVPEPDSAFWCNQESAPLLYDAIAANIGTMVVRQLDGQYHFYQPIASRGIVQANRALALLGGRAAGGDIFSSGERPPARSATAAMNAVLPQSVTACFPKYVTGNDPVPHFVNPRYQGRRPTSWQEDSYGDTYNVTVPLLSGALQFSGQLGVFVSGSAQLDANGNPYLSSGLTGTSGYTPTVHSTAKALYASEALAAPGNSPTNVSGLTSLAMQLAYDVFNAQIDAALDESYAGTYAWNPDGLHDIVWSYSFGRRQASTRVVRCEWNNGVDQMQHATPAVAGTSSVPGGAGGHSVAQGWRDSYSGAVSTTLAATLNSGDFAATLAGAGMFPTQNRWKGQVDAETVLFEGTSGGVSVGVVRRGLDGTLQTTHNNGSTLTWLTPNRTFGANLVSYEKGQHAYPGAITSGGIQETVVVPQMQSVKSLTGSGASASLAGGSYYSGQLRLYDPATGVFGDLEKVWLLERNGGAPASGSTYQGQFAGWSQSGPVAPVYLVNENGATATNASGLTWSGYIVTDVTCTSGTMTVTKKIFYFLGGDLLSVT